MMTSGQPPRRACQGRHHEAGLDGRLQTLWPHPRHYNQEELEAQGTGLRGVRQPEVGLGLGRGDEWLRDVRKGYASVQGENPQRRDRHSKSPGIVRGAQAEEVDAQR